MEAPSPAEIRAVKRKARLARVVLVLLGAVVALGAWQSFGVLIYGIEGSYVH